MLQMDAVDKKLPAEVGVIQGEQLRTIFGDGASLEGLKRQLEKFAAADKDGSGTVSYSEFCDALGTFVCAL